MNIQFPSDENGQVLQQLAQSGVDLSKAYDVDFAHLAPNEDAAHSFADQARALGFKVEVYAPDDASIEEGDTDWDVICTHEMVPSHSNIAANETRLAQLAHKHHCRPDGWGFLA